MLTERGPRRQLGFPRPASYFVLEEAVNLGNIGSNMNLTQMKTHNSHLNSRIGLLTAALLAIGATARSADQPTLKDAYKDHFYVGVAINRTIAMSAAVRADNVNRSTRFPRRTI